jgi:hypothetical protein
VAGGEELERVLGEQAAYYQALGEDYLHQGLDLPGGGELARALEAFRPTGRVLEERLRRTGWDITVTATSGPFYWGAGRRG